VLQGEVIVDDRGLKYGKGSITLNVLRVEVKFILDDRGLKYGKGSVTFFNVLQGEDEHFKVNLYLMTEGLNMGKEPKKVIFQ
jgi:hypothetical protein